MPTLLNTEWTDGRIGVVAAIPLRGVSVSPTYYYVGLGLLAVLMVFALVKAYRVWEEIHDVEEPDSPADLLESFEEAHAAGELDDEEFERVRRQLTDPARRGDGSPTPPAVDGESPSSL
jgi:uncharacterized membrane protein